MEFRSKLFGIQKIDPNTIIDFPNGLPGFESHKQFKLFHQENSQIVYCLQSLEDEELMFSVTSPVHFNLSYSFELTSQEQALLKLASLQDIILLMILHKSADVSGAPSIKGSIKGPLVINGVAHIGFQKILIDVEQSITLAEKNNVIELIELQH